jgi:O-antigen polymerase
MQKALPYITHTLLFALFGITLVQSKAFLSPFAVSYFGYHIVATIVMVWSGVLVWWQGKEKVSLVLPLLVFGSYIAYTLLNRSKGATNSGQLFLVINALVFCSILVLLQLQKVNLKAITKIFIFLAIAEALLCIAQYFDWVATRGKLFEVYGSLPNPNYTAMFLSMSVPLLLYSFFSENRFWKYTSAVALALLSASLLLLQCRTAVIGALCGASYFLTLQFAWHEKILRFAKGIKKMQLLLIGIFLIVFLSGTIYSLYHFKQASSEGRLLVWKISLDLAAQNPIFGCGTYNFEKEYNLVQAAYFLSGKATNDEVFSAAHIRVPYNDYLLSFIEGGIIGFLLFSAFMLSMLVGFFKSSMVEIKQRTAYSGILIFSIMSLFNSQYYITSVVAVFMLYAALLSSFSEGKKYNVNYRIIATILIIFGLYFLKNQYEMARGSRNIKIAANFLKKGELDKTIYILEKTSETLSLSDQLWWNYANALYNQKDYSQALVKYQKATSLTSDPDLFIDMSDCYAQLGNHDAAISRCSLAMNIVPNRLKPRYMLMNLFMAKKDTTTAKIFANELIRQTPKGVSKDADYYKEEAKKINLLSNTPQKVDNPK